MEQALEKKSWENGHVTGSRLKEILDEFHGSVNKNLDGIRAEFQKALELGGGKTRNDNDDEYNFDHTRQLISKGGNMYVYGGRFYAVPETFKFPTV